MRLDASIIIEVFLNVQSDQGSDTKLLAEVERVNELNDTMQKWLQSFNVLKAMFAQHTPSLCQLLREGMHG